MYGTITFLKTSHATCSYHGLARKHIVFYFVGPDRHAVKVEVSWRTGKRAEGSEGTSML